MVRKRNASEWPSASETVRAASVLASNGRATRRRMLRPRRKGIRLGPTIRARATMEGAADARVSLEKASRAKDRRRVFAPKRKMGRDAGGERRVAPFAY